MRLIDADALIKEAMELYCKDCERRKGIKNGKWKIVYSIGDAPCRACGTGDMIDELENAPTIEGRKKGKWEQDNPFTKPRCSECGEPCFGLHGFDYTLTPYCPNCGADMRGGDER